MGEYADYMLNGDDCQYCGQYIGEGDGYPRSCGCHNDDDGHKAQTKKKKSKKKTKAKKRVLLFCCGCQKDVEPRLTDGKEIYPHRSDLHSHPFWICDACKNYVGCHHRTKNRTRPLGNIATPEIRNARQHLHKLIDPLWMSKGIMRNEIYDKITRATGKKYHTADIRSVDEARNIYAIVLKIKNGEL